jgi:hypothetical protein
VAAEVIRLVPSFIPYFLSPILRPLSEICFPYQLQVHSSSRDLPALAAFVASKEGWFNHSESISVSFDYLSTELFALLLLTAGRHAARERTGRHDARAG